MFIFFYVYDTINTAVTRDAISGISRSENQTIVRVKRIPVVTRILVWFWFNPLQCFFGSEGHVALDRNPGPEYDTLLLRMIPGDLLSAFHHRQFHTLTGLLASRAALPNSNPNALRAMQGGSLYHFYDGLWYDPAERRTHDLPCERRTRYRLSQPDTVTRIYSAVTDSVGLYNVGRVNLNLFFACIRVHNAWVT